MNGESQNEFFYGKYQGVVTDNRDPMCLGRIKAKVPDVYGDDESGWALPCAPFSGFCALPKVNAGVWIEFIGGDPDYPVWSGCWWGSQADMSTAVLPAPEQKVVLETEGGNRITLDDTPGTGGITLETSSGQKIKLTATGIEIDNGSGATIKLSGPSVQINDQALEVT
jgi:uncharacterized protein involved in type VI secretion and phage assembly